MASCPQGTAAVLQLGVLLASTLPFVYNVLLLNIDVSVIKNKREHAQPLEESLPQHCCYYYCCCSPVQAALLSLAQHC
jgi:hypothetical protein